MLITGSVMPGSLTKGTAMRRLVLILGLLVLAWLGRRQLRSAADAQRYLTLLALLQIVAVMGKTSASPKAVAVENRLNTIIVPALGTLNGSVTTLNTSVSTISSGVNPIIVAGKGTFLAGLSSGPAPATATVTSGSATLGTACNDLAALENRYNQLRSTLGSCGILT